MCNKTMSLFLMPTWKLIKAGNKKTKKTSLMFYSETYKAQNKHSTNQDCDCVVQDHIARNINDKS